MSSTAREFPPPKATSPFVIGSTMPSVAGGPGKDACQADHDQDDGGGLGGLDEQFEQVAQGERAVDHEADEETEDHGHHRGLGGGEPARAQAAQDEDRRGQSAQEASLKDGQNLGLGSVLWIDAEVVLQAQEERRDDEQDTGQNARDDARRRRAPAPWPTAPARCRR